jgi:hypothetical protein
VAVTGNTYIGELYIDYLYVINGARVETLDRIYFNSLDIIGGELQAENFYQIGKAKTTLRYASLSKIIFTDVAADFLPDPSPPERNRAGDRIRAGKVFQVGGLPEENKDVAAGLSLREDEAGTIEWNREKKLENKQKTSEAKIEMDHVNPKSTIRNPKIDKKTVNSMQSKVGSGIESGSRIQETEVLQPNLQSSIGIVGFTNTGIYK